MCPFFYNGGSYISTTARVFTQHATTNTFLLQVRVIRSKELTRQRDVDPHGWTEAQWELVGMLCH